METVHKMTKREAGRLGNERMKVVAAEMMKKKIAEYNLHPKLCEQCNKPLPYEKSKRSRFCSSSCAATYNNVRRDTSVTMSDEVRQKISDSLLSYHGTDKRHQAIRFCKHCGKRLDRHNFHFCSNACQAAYNWNIRKKEIESTGQYPSEKPNNETDRKVARRYIEETKGHSCSICGIETWRGQPTPLVVDHIDGNAMNHKISNLRLVCPNCDAQLPTFKNRPHEAHREFRRKDYKENGYIDIGNMIINKIGFEHCGREITTYD